MPMAFCKHQPQPDTCYTTTALPADLTRAGDYPIEAVCMFCEQPICCDSFVPSVEGDWHLKYSETCDNPAS